MRVRAHQVLVAALAMGHQRQQVRLRTGRHEQTSLEAQLLGDALLEGIDGGVLAVHVVANLSVQHGGAHGGRGTGNGVAAQVDRVHGGRSSENRRPACALAVPEASRRQIRAGANRPAHASSPQRKEIAMRRAEVTAQVAERTRLAPLACENVLNTFAAIRGDAWGRASKGARRNHAYVIAEIARRTGESERTCGDIMTAFEQVVEDAFRGKLDVGRKKER
ncbi:hypothetical protein [Dyella jiangningensis]|nr:hypothetical protein [Dyella jiangningensis]